MRLEVWLFDPPLHEARSVLVVAAPERDARMVVEAAHLVLGFRRKFVDEGLVGRVKRARHHKILPDKQAEFVAEIVEDFLLVPTAAPHPHHIHVRFAHAPEHVPIDGRLGSIHVLINRDPIGTSREDRSIIHSEKERLSSFCALLGIVFSHEFDSAEPNPALESCLATFLTLPVN